MVVLLNLVLYLVSFFFIWFGSGLIIRSVNKLSYQLNISSFSFSFLILGLLTSVPEMTIGFNSVFLGDPAIFVGNLIGGSLVLFLLVIPILAILGNGIKLAHDLNRKTLLFALLVIAAPVFFTLDSQINLGEAIFLVIFYIILIFFVEKKKNFLEDVKDKIVHHEINFLKELGKIFLGAFLVIFASRVVVDKTIYFSELLNISLFIVSLLCLSIGTNLPEISLAIRSVLLKKKEVALGDYIGSAAANSLIFGVLTLIYGKTILLSNHFLQTFIFMIGGLLVFYHFTRSKNDISRQEGLILILIYLFFILFEARY
ncbi:MAG: hypothetical protein QHH09_00140 [Microgenomates group bacterium]|nr:hypothetical protein [Microgenomates group bacterium]